jgi:hypothetical protein
MKAAFGCLPTEQQGEAKPKKTGKPKAMTPLGQEFVPPPFPTMRGAYSAAKWRWCNQISEDHALTGYQFRVGYQIAKHHNLELGYAYPSHKRIADAIGGTGSGVKSAIDAMAVRGHLKIRYSCGNGVANRYYLVLKDRMKADPGVPLLQPVGDRSSKRD